MISGLNSSSLSLAMRTANSARATMDKMATQIATGKKVNSAKDDGAAYARASALKSKVVEQDTLHQIVGVTSTYVNANANGSYTSREVGNKIVGSLLALTNPYLSASTFNQLALDAQRLISEDIEYNYLAQDSELIETWGAIDNDYIKVFDSNGNDILALGNATGLDAFQGALWDYADTVAGNNRTNAGGSITTVTIPWTGRTVQLNNITDVQNALGYYKQALASDSIEITKLSTTLKTLDITQERLSNISDIADSMISSLTDADMGKVSTQRANAEVRQQLALDTVRNAISAYGAYANSLLSNVIGTQRNILA